MIKVVLLLFTFVMSASAHASTLGSWLWVNGIVGGSFQFDQPALLEFEFRDLETDSMAHHFHVMHAKPMHLIVVSEDLSHFAHVHPQMYQGMSYKPFFIKPNTQTDDPDNFAVPTMIPYGGHFMLFAEVMPMNYGMLSFPYDLNVSGPTRQNQLPEVDRPNSEGKIVKYFSDSDEVTTEALGQYQLKLEVDPIDHCQTILPRLTVEILLRDGDTYSQVKDLDPWLESYGHSIIIGRSGNLATEKAIFHLHAVWPLPSGDVAKDNRGPTVELATHSHGKSMQTDHYHVWLQVKHHSKVHTFSFEIDWNLQQQLNHAVRTVESCIN